MDDKGRIKLPASLIRQLGTSSLPALVLNRGLGKCLALFTKPAWDQTTKLLNARLNAYDPQHRDILRYFYRGATEVTPDNADRILISKSLIEYAQLGKECIIIGFGTEIEIWDKKNYDERLTSEPTDFSQTMGGVKELLKDASIGNGPTA